MAAQQTLFAETIRGMKLAMRRRDNDSDSDSSIHANTNRRNKLKRNAVNVRQGRLDTTGGRSYKRRIEHAGYHRYIIHSNPPRLDEDGDVIEPEDNDDDDDEETAGTPAEEDAYDETKLEYLLAPLTSAAELANHPSLSIPYTSRSLTEMAESARELVYREKEALWRAKQMLQRFRGDEAWVPLENMETYLDPYIFDPTEQPSTMDDMDPSVHESAMSIDHPVLANLDVATQGRAYVKQNGANGDSTGLTAQDGETNGIKAIDMAARETNPGKSVGKNGDQASSEQQAGVGTDQDTLMKDDPATTVGEPDTLEVRRPNETVTDTNAEHPQLLEDADVRRSVEREPSPTSTNGQIQHRMTTRARARTSPSPAAQASPSPSPVPSSIPSIHPLFQFPVNSLPDRDFGLPAPEAEDTRRVLVLYVQKQEQVVREAEALLQGLLKADRLRHDVFRWCKAEGHVGEMSDGEDWYDMEEWSLDQPLKKGKEEEDVEEEGRGKRKGRRGAGAGAAKA